MSMAEGLKLKVPITGHDKRVNVPITKREPKRRSYAGPCAHDGQPHATAVCPCKED